MDDFNLYKLSYLHTTVKQSWRGKSSRWDTILVYIDNMILRIGGGQILSYWGHVLGFLNALLIVYRGGTIYKFVQVTILLWLGHGP